MQKSSGYMTVPFGKDTDVLTWLEQTGDDDEADSNGP